jgi:quinoprotein glucose dehydrogenase
MRARRSRARRAAAFIIAAGFSFAFTPGTAAQGAAGGQWPTYGGDLGSTRYAALSQIDASNFGKLEVAWRFSVANLGPTREYTFESTPLVLDGVLYTTGGTRRAVTALDAATGEQLWVYSLNEGQRGVDAPRKLSGRGLAFWQEGREKRVLYVTPGYQLIALDASTGRPVSGFGKSGIVDLRENLDQGTRWDQNQIGTNSPPLVVGDIAIVGAAFTPFAPANQANNVIGYVRAYDVVTGRLIWTFHTVPRRDEPGFETWLNGSALEGGGAGNTGVWGSISADPQLGLVYLPVESPYGDMYGGLRPGANLYGESIVAVDLKTGKRRWHFQTSHHPLWDYDIPTAPILVDTVKDGKTVKSLAQATKQGLLFVLNRETGEPIWPIPEVPVPQGKVPGEWYSPTQPMPPLRYGHQGLAIDDLIDFTPQLRAEAEALVAKHLIGPIYTPPVPFDPNGPISTLRGGGGSNWPGGAYDPETHMVYVTAGSGVASMTICKNPEGSPMPHGICTGPDRSSFGGVRDVSVRGLPLLKPPYGTIAAFDLVKGEKAWEIPNGETPTNIKNHPALAGVTIGRTGRSGTPGALATKTLVIAAEPGNGPTPDGKPGSMLRAYDKLTGREVAALQLPAAQSGSPMTYELNGRQYLVIAVGGAGYPGELIAYRVPK